MVPNELRRFINQRGRPLELLAAIADGRKISAADPNDPTKKIRVYPTKEERASAARALLNKLVPDLRSTELTGADGGPVAFSPSNSTLPPDVEIARRLAFLLSKGVHEVEDAHVVQRAAPQLTTLGEHE